jgi:hypothetical protein
LSGCGVGSTQVTLAANSVTDGSGNTGPTAALASNVIEIAPDEVVNETFDSPEQPSGAVLENPRYTGVEQGIQRDKLLAEKELLLADGQRSSSSKDLGDSTYKKLGGAKVKDFGFMNIDDLQETVMLVLLALSLVLSAFALGRSARTRRRH